MKTVVKILFLLAALGIVANVAYASMGKPLNVETVTLAPETATVTFTEQGSYDYHETYTVYPVIYGEIEQVPVRKGEWVDAGAVLAVVNASEYEYQIGELQSAIDGYNAQISNLWLQEEQEKANLVTNLKSLQGQLASLDAEVQQTYSSNQALEYQIDIQEQIITSSKRIVQNARQDLNDAEDYGEDAEITQARQTYDNARNSVYQNELTLEQLKAGNVPPDLYERQRAALLAQIASVGEQMNRSYSGAMQQYYKSQINATQYNINQMRERAGKAEITAPVSGIVTDLPVTAQNVVAQQTPIAVIASGPRVEVYVPLREIDGVALNDQVELILDKRMGEEILTGKVIDIAGEAEVKLSALGVEERKVRVLVEPENVDLQIGYIMDVRFVVFTQEDALVVPKTAVFSQVDGDFVWVVRGGEIKKAPVTKGVETRSGYIIGEGLTSGDIVIRSADNQDLEDGKKAGSL